MRNHTVFDVGLPAFSPDTGIADGIGCYCGCHTREGYRSLLTCFYEGGRGMGCPICQGEAKLAYRRHKEGQSLDQIRRAIDARFG